MCKTQSGLVCPVVTGVCEEVNMSIRSKTGFLDDRALGRLERAGSADRDGVLSERAREMKRAARAALKPEIASNEDRVVATARPKATLDAWPLPGLAPMTRVRTNFGDVHAAALRKGDEVLTRTGQYLPILWLTRIRLDEQLLAQKPDSNPVVIMAGALGPNLPRQEIIVSPRQIICGDSVLGSPEREASMLVSRPGIRRIRETCLSYTMFHVGRPAEVYCEGTYLLFPMDA